MADDEFMSIASYCSERDVDLNRHYLRSLAGTIFCCAFRRTRQRYPALLCALNFLLLIPDRRKPYEWAKIELDDLFCRYAVFTIEILGSEVVSNLIDGF